MSFAMCSSSSDVQYAPSRRAFFAKCDEREAKEFFATRRRMCAKNGRLDGSLMETEVALQFARAERWASSGVTQPNAKRPNTSALRQPRSARRNKCLSSPESTMSEQTDGAESEDDDKSVVAAVVVDSNASQT